jgi:hypothetical protein
MPQPINNREEIPPYQAVDLLIGGDKVLELEPPIAGYVVTFPDSRLDAVMLAYEKATPERLEELKALSKWPDQIFYRHAWLHTEGVVYGQIHKRKYWTPR